jgi:hypothetical protein
VPVDGDADGTDPDRDVVLDSRYVTRPGDRQGAGERATKSEHRPTADAAESETMKIKTSLKAGDTTSGLATGKREH